MTASNIASRSSSASPVCSSKYAPDTLPARIERELQHQIAYCQQRLADESLDSIDRLGWRSRMNAYGTALQILEWEATRPVAKGENDHA